MFQIQNESSERRELEVATATDVAVAVDVDNFFAKFDRRSDAVTKSALKTIKRMEQQNQF